MKFNQVYAAIGHLPCTEESQCRVLYDWVREARPAQCLELGFFYGKTSCVIAAALQENGAGHLTSIDMEAVRNHQGNPNILDNLGKIGMESFVTPIFSKISYTWELKKDIEKQTVNSRCEPCYDFIFLDGAHTWETDVCAFFLAMKLLKPGGLLATFSCSGLVDAGLFRKVIFGAAKDARRTAQIVAELGHGPDHPVLLAFPEGVYLKGLLLRCP